MPLSMYQASVPLFVRAFNNLDAIIDKAVAHAEAGNYDPEIFVDLRLYPDMMPFSGQIQRASDTAKATVARLAGIEAPGYPDNEASIAELKQRIARTRDFVQSVPADKFEGSATRVLKIPRGGAEYEIAGQDYLLGRQLANFYFHITTAYDILRHNGVPIGKRDYLG